MMMMTMMMTMTLGCSRMPLSLNSTIWYWSDSSDGAAGKYLAESIGRTSPAVTTSSVGLLPTDQDQLSPNACVEYGTNFTFSLTLI